MLFFVRSVSRDDHVTYNDFMDLLCPQEDEQANLELLENLSARGEEDAQMPVVKRQLSRITPKGSEALSELAQQQDREEAEIEKEFKKQLKQIELDREAREKESAVSGDFSWLRTTRKAGKPSFLVTRHACFYDCTRGVEGQADGLPIGLEGRGKVRFARQGEARVPCLKLPSKSCLVTRVPFSKNGGGDNLNQFTITMHVKFLKEVTPRCSQSERGTSHAT